MGSCVSDGALNPIHCMLHMYTSTYRAPKPPRALTPPFRGFTVCSLLCTPAHRALADAEALAGVYLGIMRDVGEDVDIHDLMQLGKTLAGGFIFA